jgi:hypothetical protein
MSGTSSQGKAGMRIGAVIGDTGAGRALGGAGVVLLGRTMCASSPGSSPFVRLCLIKPLVLCEGPREVAATGSHEVPIEGAMAAAARAVMRSAVPTLAGEADSLVPRSATPAGS